jgi:hypothetical protein
MDDKQPVVSLVTLGTEKLMLVKIDPAFEDSTGHYIVDLQIQPQEQQIGGGDSCTVQNICLRCARLTFI